MKWAHIHRVRRFSSQRWRCSHSLMTISASIKQLGDKTRVVCGVLLLTQTVSADSRPWTHCPRTPNRLSSDRSLSAALALSCRCLPSPGSTPCHACPRRLGHPYLITPMLSRHTSFLRPTRARRPTYLTPSLPSPQTKRNTKRRWRKSFRPLSKRGRSNGTES